MKVSLSYQTKTLREKFSLQLISTIYHITISLTISLPKLVRSLIYDNNIVSYSLIFVGNSNVPKNAIKGRALQIMDIFEMLSQEYSGLKSM